MDAKTEGFHDQQCVRKNTRWIQTRKNAPFARGLHTFLNFVVSSWIWKQNYKRKRQRNWNSRNGKTKSKHNRQQSCGCPNPKKIPVWLCLCCQINKSFKVGPKEHQIELAATLRQIWCQILQAEEAIYGNQKVGGVTHHCFLKMWQITPDK